MGAAADSGEILRQILSYKAKVDEVNKEIEQTVQMTSQIESEIIRYSETERRYSMNESELAKMIRVRELELNDLTPLTATRKASLELLEDELETVKKNINDTKERISAERENFIALCDHFQSDIREGEDGELTMLLLEKEALENEKRNLNNKIDAMQASTRELLDEILEETHNSISVLEAEIQSKTQEKAEVLKDISELKNLLCSLHQAEKP